MTGGKPPGNPFFHKFRSSSAWGGPALSMQLKSNNGLGK